MRRHWPHDCKTADRNDPQILTSFRRADSSLFPVDPPFSSFVTVSNRSAEEGRAGRRRPHRGRRPPPSTVERDLPLNLPILLFHTSVGYHGYGKRTVPLRSKPLNLRATKQDEATFSEVVRLITVSRERLFQAVNTALIDLYWQVGATISRKITAAEWEMRSSNASPPILPKTQPGLRGFTRANLFCVRRFYETYQAEEKVVPLVRQLPWSHHLIIVGQSKRSEEREFYLRLAIQERWSPRELERQFQDALFERAVLSPPKVSPAVRQTHPEALSVFKDPYNLEFLGLPTVHAEADLHRGLLEQLRVFLIELGTGLLFRRLRISSPGGRPRFRAGPSLLPSWLELPRCH